MTGGYTVMFKGTRALNACLSILFSKLSKCISRLRVIEVTLGKMSKINAVSAFGVSYGKAVFKSTFAD